MRIDSEMERSEQVSTQGSKNAFKKRVWGWVLSFCPRHCSGICKRQKTEELEVNKLLFEMPVKQSSSLQR